LILTIFQHAEMFPKPTVITAIIKMCKNQKIFNFATYFKQCARTRR
jgi:hypothetical protein